MTVCHGGWCRTPLTKGIGDFRAIERQRQKTNQREAELLVPLSKHSNGKMIIKKTVHMVPSKQTKRKSENPNVNPSPCYILY